MCPLFSATSYHALMDSLTAMVILIKSFSMWYVTCLGSDDHH